MAGAGYPVARDVNKYPTGQVASERPGCLSYLDSATVRCYCPPLLYRKTLIAWSVLSLTLVERGRPGFCCPAGLVKARGIACCFYKQCVIHYLTRSLRPRGSQGSTAPRHLRQVGGDRGEQQFPNLPRAPSGPFRSLRGLSLFTLCLTSQDCGERGGGPDIRIIPPNCLWGGSPEEVP